MIILLGPDNSGKTSLVQQLTQKSIGTERPLSPWKAVAATTYKEYMEFLRGPKSDVKDIKTYRPGIATQLEGAVVCDRFFYCEWPYAHVLRGQERIQWTLKQWHNLHLSALSLNPLIVLANHMTPEYQDSVPREMFQPILREYREMLDSHGLQYTEYDFTQDGPDPETPGWAEELLKVEAYKNGQAEWWFSHPELYGVGNTVDPTVFIMAQDLGPSNVHRVPFEQGPSGYYLSDLLDGKDLSSIYLTNWIKTGDLDRDVGLLRTELENTRPTHVILLGNEAKAAGPVLDEFVAHTNVHNLIHPGWAINHGGSIPEINRRKAKVEVQWEDIWTKIEPVSATT